MYIYGCNRYIVNPLLLIYPFSYSESVMETHLVEWCTLFFFFLSLKCRDFFHPQNMIIRYYYNIIRKNFFLKVYIIC